MSIQPPEPLVAAGVDLRNFPFMPLDVRRLRDSDLSLVATGEEFKAAVLLWCAAWHQVPAASLPSDERWLARHSGAGPGWSKVRTEALRGFVLCSDDRLYHRVLAEKAIESWGKKLEQLARTKAATEARRRRQQERNDSRDDDRHGPRDDTRDDARDVHQGNGIEGNGIEGTGKPKAYTRPRKTGLPQKFEISARVQAWAAEKGFDHLPEHLEAFASKALAKGYSYADWDEAFMTAIRDDWAGLRRLDGNGTRAPHSANKQESLEERNRRVAERWKPPADDDLPPAAAAA
jgi:hypothetical protein